MNQRISEIIKSEYKNNHSNIKLISWLLVITNIVYWVIFSFIIPQHFDSIILRLFGILILIPFLTNKSNNENKSGFYSFYWFFCIFYNLAFLTIYLTLLNNFSAIWFFIITVAIFLVILVTTYLLILSLIFLLAIIFALTIFLIQGHVMILHQNLTEYILTLPLILFTAYIITKNLKKDENKNNEKTISLKTTTKEKQKNNDLEQKNINQNLKKVLLIDDQNINIKICQKLISSITKDVKIDSVNDGIEALTLLKNNKYELIITDIQMPNMNGFELSKEIRKIDKNVPITAYTSRSSYQNESDILTNDINDYIIKPIPNLKFQRIIHKWLVNNHQYNYQIDRISDSLKNLQILIADDQQVNCLMLSKFLEKFQIKTNCVNDGKQMIDKYLAELEENKDKYNSSTISKYDILIIDLNMPVLNGFDTARKIRNLEISKNIQNKPIIIAYSADNNQKNLDHALKCGMDDFFIKGLDNNQLIKLIYHWLFFDNPENADYNDKIIHNIRKIKSDQSKPLLINSKLTPEDLKDLQDMFSASSNNLLKKIIKSAHEKNFEDLAFHSHALKGIAGNIGAEKIYEYCKIINDSAKNGIWPYEQDWLDQLKKIINETLLEINRIIKQL